MARVGGEGEGGYGVVGEVPAGDGVGALVFGVDGFIDVEGRWVGGRVCGVYVWVGVGVRMETVRGWGGRFGDEGGVVAFFVVDDQSAVHVGGEEEIFGAGEPADGGDGGGRDEVLLRGLDEG